MSIDKKGNSQDDGFLWLTAPGFITFTDVTPDGASEPEFVICNEATGKYFLANRPTVQFFVAIRETGSVAHALAKSGIPAQSGEALIKRLVQSGLLVRNGETRSKDGKAVAPLESKLISLRWDLVDVSRISNAFGWLGRVLYSPLGYLAWALVILAAVQALLANSEKAAIGLRQVYQAGWTQAAIFLAIFVGVKIVHEMGHALAYRTMCKQEGIDPGPIRMGISIFAFTPFPFTDVTGAWRLRSVFRRVMIGAGGIYFETWAIGLLTLFWANTQAGMLQTIILQVAVFAGLVALLFNLNPAIKLDGYYILTDYLRKPNLSGRATQAARGFAARLLGAALPPPVSADLTYWVLSYAYRWTIFAGIFWLVYQFDPRLAPVALAIVVLTLVVRPLVNTLGFARSVGIKPGRAIGIIGSAAAFGTALAIPFPDRILLHGQLRLYETKFIEAAEPGQLQLNQDGVLELFNPELDQQIADLGFRATMLENLQRASLNSGVEQARLAAELDSFSQMQSELVQRRARLRFEAEKTAIWTALGSAERLGAWLTPGASTVLGAYSLPAPPQLLLRLDQRLLEQDLLLDTQSLLTVRPLHDPACTFQAVLLASRSASIAINDMVVLRGDIPDYPNGCSGSVKHGGGVVARLETQPRSIFQRLRFTVSRLLQDRLPIDIQ